MINPNQLMDNIIVPALVVVGADSESARELVLGTAIQESRLTYLRQLPRQVNGQMVQGPAVGLWQMEPNTHDDIWTNYLAYRPDLAEALNSLAAPANGHPSSNELIGNLWYGAAMCRIHYRRVSDPLPEQGDYEGHAAYWKEHYNTFEGAGSEEEYLDNWHAIMKETKPAGVPQHTPDWEKELEGPIGEASA